MPELADRDSIERRVARDLSRLLQAQMGRLLEELGDPPDLGNVPPSFWEGAGRELERALRPTFQEVYLASAQQILSDQPIGADWGQVNQDAADWAGRYTFELVKGINDTTQATLRQEITRFFEQGLTLGDLEARLAATFGPLRAAMIAETELTRAAVEGQRGLVALIEAQGGVGVPFWQTSRDEIVCPICRPLHNRPFSREAGGYLHPESGIVYQKPPAHVRCRCWERFEFGG